MRTCWQIGNVLVGTFNRIEPARTIKGYSLLDIVGNQHLSEKILKGNHQEVEYLPPTIVAKELTCWGTFTLEFTPTCTFIVAVVNCKYNELYGTTLYDYRTGMPLTGFGFMGFIGEQLTQAEINFMMRHPSWKLYADHTPYFKFLFKLADLNR